MYNSYYPHKYKEDEMKLKDWILFTILGVIIAMQVIVIQQIKVVRHRVTGVYEQVDEIDTIISGVYQTGRVGEFVK